MSTVPGDNHTLQVTTYKSPSSITLPYPSSYKEIVETLAKKLGLKSSSLEVFGLFSGGRLGTPNKLLMDSDSIASDESLFLQRWCFNTEREFKVVKSDDAAINLLYLEARQRLENGTIFPTPEETHELESFSDPFFPTEKQYLQAIQTIKGYNSFIAPDCRVMDKDIRCNACVIERGHQVTCVMDPNHFSLKSKASSPECLVECPWTVVKRWKLIPADSVIKFEVCLRQGNAPMLNWISFRSAQAHILFHAASAICDLLVPGATPKPKQGRLAGKGYDPLHEFINEKLFGGPHFSSLEPRR